MDILALLVMGGLAGVMAGLLGIGGGALIVPVLVIVFEGQGVNPAIIMQAALGTSLATIVFTAISSTTRITAAARSTGRSSAGSRRGSWSAPSLARSLQTRSPAASCRSCS